MPMIDEKHLQKLTSAGLYVSDPFPGLSGGVWVGKPTTTPGNCIPGFEPAGIVRILDDEEAADQYKPHPELDAPMLKFFVYGDGEWCVFAEDYAGAPGPGDFRNVWNSPDEAVEDILDFFFGNPARMQSKAEGYKLTVSKMNKGDRASA